LLLVNIWAAPVSNPLTFGIEVTAIGIVTQLAIIYWL